MNPSNMIEGSEDSVSRHLTIGDISEPRAYERERPAYRERIIGLKARRRVHVGTVMSLVFENRETLRFQVQEMARAEKMTTDAQIEHELATYNPLIPGHGELSATLFIECTDEEQMRYWFPRLVGVETSMEFRIGPDGAQQVIRCAVDPEHEAQLTRDDITSAVHYIHWKLSEDEVDAFCAGPVVLSCVHPNYREETQLTVDTRDELFTDLRDH
jgi:Protein of unknown function (DUF3501)